MNNPTPADNRNASKTTRLMITITTLLIIVAAVMIILMATGTSKITMLWNDYQIEKKLKNPANAQLVEPIRVDRAEIKRLDDIKTNTLSKIGSFGTNAPEDIFFQKEIRKIDQNRQQVQTHMIETMKELK